MNIFYTRVCKPGVVGVSFHDFLPSQKPHSKTTVWPENQNAFLWYFYIFYHFILTHIPKHTGLIGFDDFNSIMTERILDRDPIEEIKKAFKLFDDDNTGKVSKEGGFCWSGVVGSNNITWLLDCLYAHLAVYWWFTLVLPTIIVDFTSKLEKSCQGNRRSCRWWGLASHDWWIRFGPRWRE